MRVVLSCGGTGGHITPALAIAKKIGEEANAELLFLGGEGGMEIERVSALGYRIIGLPIRGFLRSFSLENVKRIALLKKSIRLAREQILAFAPDVVIGTGGYACFPALYAASRIGIPTAIHEANSTPGLAVKMLSGSVDRIWLNFPQAAGQLPSSKCMVVGNPILREMTPAQSPALPQGCRRMLLSFGGSLGAERINAAALDLMEKIAARPEIYYLHATGQKSFESCRAVFVQKGLDRAKNLSLVSYIPEMSAKMQRADVVIARAGALTISELAAARCPAILVPSPNVTGDHQRKNAAALARVGAALVIEEQELDVRLSSCVFELLENAEEKRRMARAIKSFDHPRAAEDIWLDLQKMIHRAQNKT